MAEEYDHANFTVPRYNMGWWELSLFALRGSTRASLMRALRASRALTRERARRRPHACAGAGRCRRNPG